MNEAEREEGEGGDKTGVVKPHVYCETAGVVTLQSLGCYQVRRAGGYLDLTREVLAVAPSEVGQSELYRIERM